MSPNSTKELFKQHSSFQDCGLFIHLPNVIRNILSNYKGTGNEVTKNEISTALLQQNILKSENKNSKQINN